MLEFVSMSKIVIWSDWHVFEKYSNDKEKKLFQSVGCIGGRLRFLIIDFGLWRNNRLSRLID